MCKTKKELGKNAHKYKSIKAQLKKLTQKLEEVTNEIYDYADANELLEIIGEDYIIKISDCERHNIDTKQLEADLGPLTKYETVTKFRRLYVK